MKARDKKVGEFFINFSSVARGRNVAWGGRVARDNRVGVCSGRSAARGNRVVTFVITTLVAMLLLVNLISCASARVRDMRYPVYVTNSRVIDLLPPEYMTGELDSLYMFTAQFGGMSFYLQAYAQADSDGIFLTLLNDFGANMGSLSYSRDGLSFESGAFPESLEAQYIVADIQFAFYDEAVVRAALREAGLDLLVTRDGAGEELRRVMNGKNCVEEIAKSPTTVKIINHLRGYEYTLIGAAE